MDEVIVELRVVQPETAVDIRLRARLAHPAAQVCCLIVVWPAGSSERIFEASDFYEGLRCFRRVVEAEGYRVLCQGARPNVHPSPMGRDAGGLKAYALAAGEPGCQEDLVSIFDSVDDIASVGTVEHQDAFLDRHRELLLARAR
ncbi:hypothetical protein [Inquilinus sp. OTU3971]|uniref:hypothetical protein n=1 Tax=Inquilinus sp. OTU3971 TaxID=3043855 RepID=UPI00313C9FC9